MAKRSHSRLSGSSALELSAHPQSFELLEESYPRSSSQTSRNFLSPLPIFSTTTCWLTCFSLPSMMIMLHNANRCVFLGQKAPSVQPTTSAFHTNTVSRFWSVTRYYTGLCLKASSSWRFSNMIFTGRLYPTTGWSRAAIRQLQLFLPSLSGLWWYARL